MAFRRRKSREPVDAADAVQGLLRTLGLTDQARSLQISLLWARAVGPGVAKRTEVERFSRGVLVVRAGSSAWQNELTFMKERLKDVLNRELGSRVVRDIKIVAGTKRRAQAPKPARRRAPTQGERDYVEAVSACISDAEIRAAFQQSLLQALTAHPPDR